MSHDPDWATFEGPFSGNAVFKAAALRPPLQAAWTLRQLTPGFHAGSRVGGGGQVFVADGATGLRAIDVRTGRSSWSLDDGRAPDDECAYAGGRLLSTVPDEGSPYGVRVVVRSPDGGRVQASFPGCLQALGTFDRGGPRVRLGAWVIGLDGDACEVATRHGGRTLDGRLVGSVEGEGRFQLACRELATEAVRWKVETERGRHEEALCLTDEVVVTHLDGVGFEPRVRVREVADGSLRLELPTTAIRSSMWPVAVAGGLLYRWEGSRLLAHDLNGGEVRWSFRAYGAHSNVVVTLRHVWLAAETKTGSELIALHRGTGELQWYTGINARPRGLGLALIDESLLVTAGRTLTCWRA